MATPCTPVGQKDLENSFSKGNKDLWQTTACDRTPSKESPFLPFANRYVHFHLIVILLTIVAVLETLVTFVLFSYVFTHFSYD